MGLFGNKEQIDTSTPPEDLAVADYVAENLLDVGQYYLEMLTPFLDEPTYEALRREVDERRTGRGWVAYEKLSDVPSTGRKQVPLSFLKTLAGTRSPIAVGVWGSSGKSGGAYKTLSYNLQTLARSQGHAAAATWAIIARPDAHFDLDVLNQMLVQAWDDDVQWLTNKDVIKAMKNWRKA